MVATVQHLERWQSVAARALDSGATPLLPRRYPGDERRPRAVTPAKLRWNVAGKCSRPIYREYIGRKAMKLTRAPLGLHPPPKQADLFRTNSAASPVERVDAAGPPHVIEMDVRCRQCPECLKARARHWRLRAEAECAATQGRTWFVTLTCRPAEHSKAYHLACHRLAAQGLDFDRLPRDEQFRERVNSLGPEITRWLKRVRKVSGAKLRYLLVVEAHKSGLPHFHMLLHEVDPAKPVRASVIQGQWHLGFSQSKLVAQDDNRAASYATKYLTKSSLTRCRASQGYGLTEGNTTISDHSSKYDERECKAPSLTLPQSDATDAKGRLPNVSHCKGLSGSATGQTSTVAAAETVTAPAAGQRQQTQSRERQRSPWSAPPAQARDQHSGPAQAYILADSHLGVDRAPTPPRPCAPARPKLDRMGLLPADLVGDIHTERVGLFRRSGRHQVPRSPSRIRSEC